jgi:tetratricopeptide (TPR) repeat protein
MIKRTTYFIILFSVLVFVQSCSIKKIAINSVANALTESGTSVFAIDDDPELIGEALPFALKTMEAVLQSTPKHKKLLVATSAGFVQYAHAYVLRPAEQLEFTNLSKAKKGRQRAKRLFIRARNYGLRALDLEHPGFSELVIKDPSQVVTKLKKKEVPALYWTGAAWASAISVDKSDFSLVGDLPSVTAIMEKALELDPDWEKGFLHEFFIAFDASRTEAEGGGVAKAEDHFKKAMELNEGRSMSPLVSVAGSICIKQQNKERFEKLLKEVIDFNSDQYPEYQLSNILAKRKAEFLLENIENYFF